MSNKHTCVDFETVKGAVNITKLLEHYGLAHQFEKSCDGDTWSGPCPIHRGVNPTQFYVSVSKNCWHCVSDDCHAHGNVLDFVSRMDGCSVSDAAKKLAEWFHIDSERTSTEQAPCDALETKEVGDSKFVFERYVITQDGKMCVEMPAKSSAQISKAELTAKPDKPCSNLKRP